MVIELLGGSASPIGWVVSFIEAPLDRVVGEACRWRRSLGQGIGVSDPTPFPACLSLLEPLETPWATELFIDAGTWTGYLNNDRNGGDPSAAAPHLSKALGARLVVANHSPLHGPGHAATQFWLLGPDGEPPLRYVRTVAAVAEDGHWSWHASGTAQAFERPERYTAMRVPDRLDRALLIEYLVAMKINVDDPSFLGLGVALRQNVSWPTTKESAAQALERLALRTT